MKKKFIIMIFLIVLFLIPKNSLAYVWNGGVNGVGGYVSSCSSGNYCYSMVGLRASLYRHEGTTAQKVGRSHDYWKTLDSDGSNQNDPLDQGSSGDSVSSLFNDDVNDKKKNNLIPGASRFNVSLSTYRGYNSTMVTYLGSSWKWDYRESSESSKFISWMNNTSSNAMFQTLDEYDEISINLGLSSSEKEDMKNNKQNYYLVVETLFGVWVGSSSTLPSGGFSRSKYYIGTLYELNAFTTKFGGMQLYAEGLIAPSTIGSFVGNNSSNMIRISQTSDNVTQNYIKNNYGIGMAVFKLSDIVQEKTCKDICTIGNLECAENYCESNTTDSTKRTCIVTECGYGEKSKRSCPFSNGTSTSSTCHATGRSNAKTCLQSDNGDNFYSISCDEETKVIYSNDLPTVLYPGISGFNYSTITSGEKKCTLDFNYERFMLEYAAKKRKIGANENPARKNLRDQLDAFISINENYNIDKYKYIFNDDSSNGISLIINGNTFKLIRNESVSKTSDKYIYTNTKDRTIYMYGATNITKNNVFTIKTLSTTNSELFELPLQCYSLITGKISPLSLNGTCGDINEIKNIAYYGYYSLLKNDEVPTQTITVKKSSGLNDANTCKYYNHNNLDDDFNCKLTAEKITSIKYKITYEINDRSNNSISYMLNGNDSTSIPSSITIDVPADTSKYINASITGKIGSKYITKSCPITIKSTTVTGESCPDKFKAVHYDAIRNYCNNSWKIDKNNYSSFSDCYNSCSATGRKNTCKTKYSCTSTNDEIEGYCNLHYDKDGYKSPSACINDCSCKELTTEYFYRPISLAQPFPKNREAGSNWIGFENSIINESFSGKDAEYVVELDNKAISNIKNDTHTQNKSGVIGNTIFNYSGSYAGGVYTSDFIHKDFKQYFVCINSSGEC